MVNVFSRQVVLAEKPLISEETDLLEPSLLDQLVSDRVTTRDNVLDVLIPLWYLSPMKPVATGLKISDI